MMSDGGFGSANLSFRRIVPALWGAEGVSLLASIVQAVVSARILGVADYGRAAVLLAIPALIFSLLNPQSEEAVTQFLVRFRARGEVGKAHGSVRLAYRLDALLAVAGWCATVAVQPVASRLLDDVELGVGLLLVAAVAVAADAWAATSRSVLAATGRFTDLARWTAFLAVIRAVLVIGGAFVGGLSGFIVGGAVAQLVQSTLLHGLAVRALDTVLGPRPAVVSLGADRRDFLRFLVYSDLTTVATVLVKQADILILSAARPPSDVGAYRLASTVVSSLARVQTPLNTVVLPRLAELANRDGRIALRAYTRILTRRVSVPLACLGVAGFPVLAYGLPALVGEEFGSAVAPALWLYGGALLSVVLFWVRPALLALRCERGLFVLSLVSGGATVGGMLAVAATLGSAGVAAVRALVAGWGGTAGAWALLRSRFEVDQ